MGETKKRACWVLGGVLLLALVAVVAKAVSPAGEAGDAAAGGTVDAAPLERLLLGVESMTCGSCEGRIRAALEARPGVRAVAVDLARKTVTVEYAVGSDDPKALAEAVTRNGYPARFLAAGAGVAPAAPAAARPRGGCGGNCCAGG